MGDAEKLKGLGNPKKRDGLVGSRHHVGTIPAASCLSPSFAPSGRALAAQCTPFPSSQALGH